MVTNPRCSVCTHEKRLEIEQAVLGGSSIRQVSANHDLNQGPLSNHMSRHAGNVERPKPDSKSAETYRSLKRANALFRQAEQEATRLLGEGKSAGATPLLAEARQALVLVSRLQGELTAGSGSGITQRLGLSLDALEQLVESHRDSLTASPEHIADEAVRFLRSYNAAHPTDARSVKLSAFRTET